ncbi:MAG: hypothetical protein ACOYXB_04645 [Bacteroidota bacterium]
MKRIAIIASVLLVYSSCLQAQDQTEALRYSMYTPVGTARFMGMGGAMGAIGGDFSAVSFNPAGLAVYRSSEFELTPSLLQVRSESDYLENHNTSTSYDFNFASLGYVAATRTGREQGLVGINFGFGYNTLANFSSLVSMRGINNNNSFLDDLTLYANNNPDNLDPFYEGLGFESYLIPYDTDRGEYWNNIAESGYGEQQVRQVETSGYLGEYSFSTALNFSDFLYVGASLGLQSVRYNESIAHYETDLDDHIVDFQSFRFREFNSTRGSGVNFKIGAIIRPVQMLRLGVSLHLPTFYSLTEQKETDMASYWDAGSGIDNKVVYSPFGEEFYRLRTPLRATASAAIILGKVGLVSLDYEYVDYRTAYMRSSTYAYLDENDAIGSDYRAVHNLKLGGEVRFSSLYLRAGVQSFMSPYRNQELTGPFVTPAFGIGYRKNNVFIDLSYQHKTRNEIYGLYTKAPGVYEVAQNKYTSGNVLMTLGVRF